MLFFSDNGKQPDNKEELTILHRRGAKRSSWDRDRVKRTSFWIHALLDRNSFFKWYKRKGIKSGDTRFFELNARHFKITTNSINLLDKILTEEILTARHIIDQRHRRGNFPVQEPTEKSTEVHRSPQKFIAHEQI